MPFPNVKYCIVCEEVRPETSGKATILGFYGILPKVDITVHDLSRPIQRLGFMLICDGGEAGEYDTVSQIEGPQGIIAPVGTSVESVRVALPATQGNRILIFGFAPLQFRGPGEHRFRLQVDGKLAYTDKFSVK